MSHANAEDDPFGEVDPCFKATNVTSTTATLEWEPLEGVQSYRLKITNFHDDVI